MFKSEPNLFLRANNNVNSAKTLINECKRLIIDFDLEGNSACSNLKSNINSCNIDALVTRIENTKQSLMELDQSFASEYMMLLQEYLSTASMNTSNMTEEEMMQYSIYSRDYNQILLNMLEKYEESGMLTEEMKQQLEYQRQLVAQYELEDKMAVLDPSSDEYINLFKQSAGHNRNMIILNPSLTDEEKVAYLEQFDAQYNQNLESLISARNEKIQRKKDEAELQELYKFKENNNGFFHPFVEDEINEAILDKRISMGATEDEKEYKNMGSFDRFCADSKTFVASTYTGLFNIVEGMTDGVVMLSSAFGTEEYKSWATEYTTRDISGEMYQGIQLSTGMNSYSAYGDWHEAGLVFGETAGKIGMTFAAPWVNAVMSGFKGMGQSAEASLLNGDDYEIAMLKGIVSGVAGASEGYGMSKLNLNIREFVSSGALKVFGKNAIAKLKNLPMVLKNTPLKTVIWNGVKTIVKNAGTSLGATLIDPDALIETGTVLASEFLDGVADGEIDTEKMFKEAGAVFITNWVMNGITGMAFGTSSGTAKGDVDTKVVNTNAEYMKKVNSVDKYKVKYNKELDFANDLKASGCTDAQIATQFAAKASQCSDIGAKKDLYDFAYKYLETSTGSSQQAVMLVNDAFNGQLNARGMTTVYVDETGIKYNDINKINNKNQAYTMDYIQQEINKLPEPMRKSITEINRYDTVNPADAHWQVEYKNPNHYSAATGGRGQINIWANSSTYPTTISHEAAHCFDTKIDGNTGKYSGSAEYKAAMEADDILTGKRVTDYAKTNSVEDFAESMAHYLKDPDGFDFPNRKAYFEQILKNPDGNLVKTNVIDANPTSVVTASAVTGASSSSIAGVMNVNSEKFNKIKIEYGDKIEKSISKYMEINSMAIETEFKVDAAKSYLTDICGASSDDVDAMFHWSNETYVLGDSNGQKLLFDDSRFASDVSSKYGVDYDEVIKTLNVSSDAKYVSILDDLENSARIRMYEDLSVGVKDIDGYLEQKFLTKDFVRESINYSNLGLKLDSNGIPIKNLDGNTIRISDHFDEFVKSDFYKNYTENILGADYVARVKNEFLGGKSTGNVYCVQNAPGLDYTSNKGTFGRPEGANVFSEKQMVEIFNSAITDGTTITANDLDDIFSGKKTVNLDSSKIAKELDLPADYLNNGGAIVRSQVSVNDLRATTYIDDAANSRFTSGMHTAHTPELMARQKMGLSFDNISGTNIYFDSAGKISYLKL